MVDEQLFNWRGSVCQTCGDKGWKKLLLCCNKCKISVEHRYCLAKIPDVDDTEFTYICAQCVLSSLNQTSAKQSFPNALPLGTSRRRKNRRRRIYQPAPLVQDLEKSPVNSSSSVSEVEAVVPTCDSPPSSQTSVSDFFINDVLPQTDMNENNSSPRKIDQPAALITDLKKSLVNNSSSLTEVEAEVLMHDILLPLQISVSEPFVNDVLPQTDLNESNTILNKIGEPAAIVQDLEKRQADNGSCLAKKVADAQMHDFPPSFQTTLVNADEDQELKRNHGRSIHDDKIESDEVADLNEKHKGPHCSYVGRNGVRDLKRRRRRYVLDEEEKSDEEDDSSEKNRSPRFCVVTDGDQELGRRLTHDRDISNEEADVNEKTMSPHWSPNCYQEVDDQVSDAVPIAKVDPVSNGGPLQVASPHTFIKCHNEVYANPIIDPVWMGFFEICREKAVRLVAHLSDKACPKVADAAQFMPPVLYIKMIPRLEAWPKSFQASAPTSENIALYFFPGGESAQKDFDNLMNHIITCDLALKVLLENAELLIFSSNQLPFPNQRFNGSYYVWGVFRGRKDLASHDEENSSSVEMKKKIQAMSLRRSPLSPLSMDGSFSSDSSRAAKEDGQKWQKTDEMTKHTNSLQGSEKLVKKKPNGLRIFENAGERKAKAKRNRQKKKKRSKKGGGWVSKASRICYFCGNPGHQQRECRGYRAMMEQKRGLAQGEYAKERGPEMGPHFLGAIMPHPSGAWGSHR